MKTIKLSDGQANILLAVLRYSLKSYKQKKNNKDIIWTITHLYNVIDKQIK